MLLKPEQLNHKSTEELKQELLQLVQDQDLQPLKQKVQFYEDQLAPIVTELSRRNPYPQAEDQLPIILGVWKPIWSSIPFQDILPGRSPEQSYQIFHDDGFYANIARYAPGSKLKLSWLQKLASILLAFDLMIVQKYAVKDGQWLIENIAIKQALRWQGIPLSVAKADHWFTKIVSQKTTTANEPEIENLNRSTAKRIKTAFRATPEFEHLYIDRDFRIVKTRREAKQRASYTIVVRREEKG
ncbi:hypothetical protein STA3757_00650 [Stanieria sp. NIES-3757]|nr:hypothetical protein STA3757_00650 [Stanieria sp. NIES-3757]